MRRVCDACGTPLPGKGHGLVVSGRVLCGRAEVQKSVRVRVPIAGDNGLRLQYVKTPRCEGKA